MTLTIEKPSMKYVPSFIDALREGAFTHMALGGFGNTTAEEVTRDPQAYLDLITSPAPRAVKTPNGREFTLNDHEIFWITDGKDRFLGGISLRYDADNDLINKYCGHAGMGVRASLLNKGYGIKAIEHAWEFGMQRAKEKNLPALLASCAPGNRASQRLIQHFGGQLVETGDPFGWGPAELYTIKLRQLEKRYVPQNRKP